MKRPLQLLVSIGAFGVMSAVGLLGARALSGDGASESASTPSEQTTTLIAPATLGSTGAAETPADIDGDGMLTPADLMPEPDRIIPVIAPTAVGTDPAIGDALADPPAGDPAASVAASGSAAAPEVIGAIAAFDPIPDAPVPSDEPGSTDVTIEPTTEPSVVASPLASTSGRVDWLAFSSPINLLESIGPIVFDPCAGARRGDEPGDTCPAGYAATFDGAIATPPRPWIYVYSDHPDRYGDNVRPCPARPEPTGLQRPMTLITATPLAALQYRIRPYGSLDPWTEVDIGPTDPADVAWWNSEFARSVDEPFAQFLTTCFLIDRTADVPYEYVVSGTDIFGRFVELDRLNYLPQDNPGRPPTTAEVGRLDSVATVQAWTVREGSVVFRTRPVRGADDPFTCDGTTPIEPERVVPFLGATPIEILNLYDGDYERGWLTRIALVPGQSLLVCADILPDDNPLRPTATDRLLLTAPMHERPRVVLQAIRRFDTPTIGAERIYMQGGGGSTSDRCTAAYTAPELQPNRTYVIERPLWECTIAPLPADSAGTITVPIRISRYLGSGRGYAHSEVAVRIQLEDTGCTEPAGCRAREWYEVPLPFERPGLCADACPAPDAGVAVVRVEYPVVPGAVSTDAVRLLDEIVPPPPSGVPSILLDAFYTSTPGDRFRVDATYTVSSDRPVQLSMAARGPFLNPPGGPCDGPAAVTSSAFSSRSTLTIRGLCVGMSYDLVVLATDETGATYDLSGRLIDTMPDLEASVQAVLQIIAADDEYGDIRQVEVDLNDLALTASAWEMAYTNRRGTGGNCVQLVDTLFRQRDRDGQTARLNWGVNVLRVRLNIRRTGFVDCDDDPRVIVPGEVGFDTELTQEQLTSSRPIVLESPADADERFRVELTISDFRLDR